MLRSSIQLFLNNSNKTSPLVRFMSGGSFQGHKLIYTEYGDPVKVVELQPEQINSVQGNEVLVKMLAAPVNPADINTIEGKYPSRPELPAVPGNEGVAEIVQTGSDVPDLAAGDRVVLLKNMLGTWRSHLILNRNEVLKIPKELGKVEASTLTVNPCTAYRMLKDFVDLQPGDVVIQNGANSAAGQNVIQLARIWNINTVNIIRDRPEVGNLKSFLKELGATEVLTEEELRTTDLFRKKKLPKPKLALNCVGGKNALEVLRQLDHGATMVTYGGMSREPVMVPTAALIFKDVRVRGFWITEWSKRNSDNPEREVMFNDLIQYMLSKQLHGPAYKLVKFNDYKEALMNTMTIKGMIGLKYILDFEGQ